MKYLVFTLATFSFLAMADITTDSKQSKEQMEKAMKLMTPGENHAILKDLVGKWKATTSFWMEAGAKPEESKGTQTAKMILDGRFLQTEFKGTAMGKPFTGMGIMGYDNVKGEYQSIWLDSMGTAMMVSNGSYDAATHMITETGKGSCPMTGEKDKMFRGEWKLIDKKNYTYSLFTTGSDGKEFKTMEITFKKG